MIISGPLTYLLGHSKLKLVKFLLHNRDEWFPIAELAERTKIPVIELRKELKQALKFGVVQEKKQDKVLHYQIRQIPELQVLEDVIFTLGDSFFGGLTDKIHGVGEVYLCVAKGTFLQREHDKVDLFLVIDEVDEKKFTKLIESIEAELGKEIRYALHSLSDFEYRKNMFDKFVWSVLEDTRSKILVDKLSVMSDNR